MCSYVCMRMCVYIYNVCVCVCVRARRFVGTYLLDFYLDNPCPGTQEQK